MADAAKPKSVTPESTEVFVFPASFAQQRLWFLDRLEPGNRAYNLPMAFRIQGPLDVTALEQSFSAIVERHESLRTTFSLGRDGDLQQLVHAHSPMCFHPINLESVSETAREAEIARLLEVEASRAFDLASGPLFRVTLTRLAQEDHLLLVVAHHIITDGWSGGILLRELGSLYEAFVAGKPSPLPPLKIQYGDFAAWQRNRIQGDRLDSLLAFWKKQAIGATTLELPLDRPRGREHTFEGSEKSKLIPKPLVDELKRLAQQSSATLFMALVAAIDILLSRYSGQEDIIVGSPIAGRTRPELEALIGFFANTIVLRTDLSGNPSFRQLVARVRQVAMDAYSHEELPLEKLIEELNLPRELGRNPLFQVFVNLQNTSEDLPVISGLNLTPVRVDTGTAKFDLSFGMMERKDGLRVRISYNTYLFDPSTIERMLGHLEILLRAIVGNPDQPISELPLLPESEHQLLAHWNATEQTFFGGCLHEWIEQQSAATPSRIAARFGKDRLTFAELNSRANRIANYLRKRGVGPGVLVGIFVDRSLDMLAGLLGILKAGAAYVPLDPSYPKERIGFILEDANAPVLLSQRSLLSVLPQTNAQTVCLDGDWNSITNESSENLAVGVQPSDLAYVLYTSGSTGKPKGVQIEHRNLTNFLASMQRKPGFTADDILLAVTTLSFDIAGLELYLPLVCGGQVAIASREEALNPNMLQALLRETKATVMQATPATWRMLIESGWAGSSQLKVLCGGEALPADLAAQLLPRCRELWNMYGPTETTIWSSVYQVSEHFAGSAPIGKPIANTTMYVLDAHFQLLPVGVTGELYIGGEGVARGYWKRPELTAEKFLLDPFSRKTGARLYRTGDLAKFLPDGSVQYLGRADFQVKVRGFRIELGEIENAMAQHPAVRQAVVAAREDRPGDKRLVAYAVLAPGQQLSISDLRSHLRRSLPEYMIPAALVELASLPLTPNGKVDRKRLPAPEFSAQPSAEKVGPRDSIETTLVQIWQQILGTSSIGVTDNFFDLGGHSLMAVRLISEIKAQMGKEIPLAALFQGATIEYLANIVRGSLSVSPTLIHKIQTSGSHPPFFAAVLAGVNALGYIPLSKHLGPEQPVYALQRPGPGPLSTGRPYTRKEYAEVAAEYIEAMRSIQPEGPYHIGGTCEGAHIAFEMVRQLESAGQKVNVLAIFDTWVLENTQIRSLWRLYYYWRRLRQLRGLPLRSVAAASAKAVRLRLHRWTGLETTPTDWTRTYWPGEKFVAPRIRSRITVFKIPKQPFYYRSDELLGWGPRTLSGVDTEVIAHGRHRFLLREPYVRELASALARVLRRVQSPSMVEHEYAPAHEVLVSP